MKVFVLLALACAASARPQIIYNSWPWGQWGGVHYAAPTVTYAAASPAITTYAAASPAITTYAAPTIVAAAPVAIPVASKTQYHAQDELGQYSYGYAGGPSAKNEVKDAFGNVQGSYSYVDPNGKQVIVQYTADSVNGFKVAANNLPVGPTVPVAPVLVGPAPVQETPEVAEARAAHLKAIEEAVARNAEADKKDAVEEAAPKEEPAPEHSRRKRGVLTYAAAPLVHTPAVTYTSHVVAAHAPVVTYSAPVVTKVATPVLSAATVYAAQPTFLAAPAVRAATLTTIHNNPGHAVSYRVD